MKRFDSLSSDRIDQPLLFLEASAGTGKTFAIENIVVKLVLGIDKKPVPIDEILIVTFTKAATKELKSRVSSALIRAYDLLLSEAQSGIPYLDQVEDRPQKLHILMRAIQNIELIHIYTIHGYCFRMLKQFALEAKIELIDEQEEVLDLKELFLDEFRSISPEHLSAVQLKLLMRHHKHNFKKLVVSLERMLQLDSEVEPVPSFNDLLNRFNATLAQFEKVDKERFMNDIVQLVNAHVKCLDKNKQLHKPFEKQLNLLMMWLETGKIHSSEFEQMLYEKVYFFEYFAPQYRKKSVKEEPKLFYPQLITKIRDELFPILKLAKNPHHIALYLLGLFHPRIKEQIETNPIAYPDALLKKMAHSLDKGPFLKAVQALFKVAIIDEFQDTDPIQWNLLKRTFIDPAHPMELFAVVGDPKQSIYSFRSADLNVYFEAKQTMGEEAYHVLDTNYRSDPKLTSELNHLFNLEKPFTFSESELKLGYYPVQSGFTQSKGGEMTICVTPQGEEEEHYSFAHIRNTIIDLAEKGVPFDQMAILVKDRYQSKKIQAYLEESSIPSHSLRTTSLAKTEAYRFLVAFFNALEAPYDDSKLKGVLSHRFFNLSIEELMKDETIIKWQQRFIALRELADNKDLAAVWNQFTNYDEYHFYRHLVKGKEVTHYCDVEVLIDNLLAKQKEHGAHIAAMLRYLHELKQADPDLEESARRKLSKAVSGVEIMTTHMSKGLEFEVVFALGVGTRTNQSESIVTIKKKLRLFVEGDQEIIDQMRALDEEKLRQFYVALTRARTHLYLYLALSEEKPKFGEASASELFFAKQKTASYVEVYDLIPSLEVPPKGLILEKDESKRQIALFEMKEQSYRPPSLMIDHQPSLITSFSGLTKGETHRVDREESDERTIQNLPAGALVGTIIHEIFEKVIDRRLHVPYQGDEIGRIVQEMVALSPLEEFDDLVEEMVYQALYIPLIEGKRLVDIDPNKVVQEVEFTFFEEENLYLKGFADLIFEVDGKVYLLDWKTNYLLDYTQGSLKDAMELHKYDLQAAIYMKALKKVLALQDQKPFGGAIYLFLRGVERNAGVYHFMPEELCLSQ